MKPPRPIGVLRLIEPLLGRGRRRWRGGPLVPMIWRRRLRGRAAPLQAPARPVPAAQIHALNLTLVWPAGTAARTEVIRRTESGLREIVRVGRDVGVREAGRLVTLVNRVERTWSGSGKDKQIGAAVPAPMNARQPPSAPAANGRRAGPEVSLRQGGRSALPAAAARTLTWPRARTAMGGAVPRSPTDAGEPASPGSATVIARAERAMAAAPRIHDLRRARAAAMRHANGARAAMPAAGEGAVKAGGDAVAMRAPAAMAWRAPAIRAENPAIGPGRPTRPRTALVWRTGEAGGEGPTPAISPLRPASGTELVWRRPAPVAVRDESGPARGAALSAAGPGEVHARAERPAMQAAPAPAAIQPAEMSRLVDEVVRRLDRIGRDERMRRGI